MSDDLLENADTVPGVPPLAERVARGSILNILVQALSGLITYLAQLVLAWLLVPADFGVLALASSFMTFVAVFRDAGATKILVQRYREFEQLAGTVFVFTITVSILCGLFTAAASPIVARIFGVRELVPVLLFMAVRFPLSAMGTVSIAKLSIDMRWRAIGVVQLTMLCLSSALSIIMAATGFGVFSLVVPQMIADALRGPLYWWLAGVRGNRGFSAATMKSILGSSAYIVGSGLTLAARSQGDYVTLGLLATIAETGYYFFAYTTAGMLGRYIVNGLTPVLFTVFSRVSDERERQEMIYRRSLHAVAIVLVPLASMQVVLARPAFRLLLSQRWQPAASLFAVLSVLHLFILLNGIVVQTMQSRGHYRRMFLFDLSFAPLEVAMFILGARFGGAMGVSVCGTVSAIIGFLMWHYMCYRTLGFSWRRTLLPIWRLVPACAPLLALGLIQTRWSPTPARDVASIAITTIGGIAAYFLLLKLIWRSAMDDILGIVQRSFPMRRVTPCRAT